MRQRKEKSTEKFSCVKKKHPIIGHVSNSKFFRYI